MGSGSTLAGDGPSATPRRSQSFQDDRAGQPVPGRWAPVGARGRPWAPVACDNRCLPPTAEERVLEALAARGVVVPDALPEERDATLDPRELAWGPRLGALIVEGALEEKTL